MGTVDSTNAYVLNEPPEISELRFRTEEVRSRALSEARDRPGDDHVYLGGGRQLIARMRQLEPRARHSVRVMQPHYFYDPEDPGVAMTRRVRARGIETDLMTLPATPRTHPLLSSIFPNTILGPVFLRAMLVDDEVAVIEGPDTAEGDRSAFYTERADLVDQVRDLWERTAKLCVPLLCEGQEAPLTERQLQVARLLAVGEKDQAIARLLSMSARTVERDVQRVLRMLGASSRTEAVLLMRGRGVNSGSSLG